MLSHSTLSKHKSHVPYEFADDVDLPPTQSPFASPIAAPTIANEPPVGEPGSVQQQPDQSTADDNEEHDSSSLIFLNPVSLTYVWPRNNELISRELDRSELHTLTSRHILEALQAEFGLRVVNLHLILTSGQEGKRTRTETLTGNFIVLHSEANEAIEQHQNLSSSLPLPMIISQEQLQQNVVSAFQGNAMELYLFRLQIAQDSALRNIMQVILGSETSDLPDLFNKDQNSSSDDGDGFFSLPILMAISASVGAVLLALCCFTYCLLRGGNGQNHSRIKNNRRKHNNNSLPAVSTKSSQEDDAVAGRRGGNELALERAKSSSSPPHIIYEDEENRSLYSYLNHNDDALSAAPSFLYSFHEAEFSKGDSLESHNSSAGQPRSIGEKKGVLWSVMDSFQAAFVNDEDEVDDYDNDGVSPLSSKEEASAKPSSFRERPRPYDRNSMCPGGFYAGEGDKEDDNQSTLTFDDNRSMLTYDYDVDGDSSAAQTPVKKRFEALWKEDDENDYLPTTAKKCNRTMLVYEDDEEEASAESNNTNSISHDASDDSPSTLLSQASEVPTMLLTSDQPCIVERTPASDDDDDKYNLPLPLAISTTNSPVSVSALNKEVDETERIGSNQSNNSTRSSRSSRSSASSHPGGQPTNSTAAACTADVVSFRNQRNISKRVGNGSSATTSETVSSVQFSSDNRSVASSKSAATNASQKSSSISVRSTDSAKFRSLLNQEDTNDAALFNINATVSAENSNLISTKLSSGNTPSPLLNSEASSLVESGSKIIQVPTLIQSFDKALNSGDEPEGQDVLPSHTDIAYDMMMNPMLIYDKKNNGNQSNGHEPSGDDRSEAGDASTVASVHASETLASF